MAANRAAGTHTFSLTAAATAASISSVHEHLERMSAAKELAHGSDQQD
jgi:hypothetical protein